MVLKHALRNALTPVITLGALELRRRCSAGAVLTEQIFTIPGFGKLIVDAVFNRDYSVVQGVVLLTATVYIVLNLLADVAYFLVNPRHAGCRQSRTCCKRKERRLRPCGGRRSSSCSRWWRRGSRRYDPLATSWSAVRAAPSAAYWFGADELGRDVLSRDRLGHAGLAARRRRVGDDRRSRSACRSACSPATSAAGSTR